MEHLLVFYYITVALLGTGALVVCIFGSIRSRLASYAFLIAFYGFFTINAGTAFITEYVFLNIPDLNSASVVLTGLVSGLSNFLCVSSFALFWHRFYSIRFQRARDVSIVVLTGCVALLYTLSGFSAIDEVRGTMVMNGGIVISNTVYIAIFAYLMIMIAAGSKRDRTVRELVLIWTSFVFGIVGFIETVSGFINMIRIPVQSLQTGPEFLVSTIPYALFGVVLVYYFGSYILADSAAGSGIDDVHTEKYGITSREREVIKLMNRGLSNREIAEKLFVSLATIKTHAHNIYEKTGVKSRYELFHLMVRNPDVPK